MSPHRREHAPGGPRHGWWRREDGQVTAFVLVVTIAILAMAGLGLDGGLALAAEVEAGDQAESAARAGAQAIDLSTYRGDGTLTLDPIRAEATAQTYLARIGATGVVTVSQDTVTVTVTAVHRTQLLSLVGIARISVHGSATASLQRGGTTGETTPPARSGP